MPAVGQQLTAAGQQQDSSRTAAGQQQDQQQASSWQQLDSG